MAVYHRGMTEACGQVAGITPGRCCPFCVAVACLSHVLTYTHLGMFTVLYQGGCRTIFLDASGQWGRVAQCRVS